MKLETMRFGAMQAAAATLALALTAGCTKDNDAATASDAAATATAPMASGSAAVSPAGSASGKPAASAAAAGSAAPGAASGWTGTYKSEKGTLFVPDGGEWSGVKWRGDDGTSGIGDGTLTLAIDADGRVSGTVDGALGPLVVSGLDRNGELTASLRPTGADGFTGTLLATDPPGDAPIEGTMKLSDGQNRLLRTAAVHLTKK